MGCNGYDVPVNSHLLAAGLLAIAEILKNRIFHLVSSLEIIALHIPAFAGRQ
jgi:hypothetical protein